MPSSVIDESLCADAGRAMDGLRRVVRALRTGNVRVEGIVGISSAQLFALRAIASQPGGSLQDLAGRTLTSQSSVSEVVSRLVAKRLVKREPSPEDRRRLELTITAKGTQLMDKAPSTVQEQLAAGFMALNPTQCRVLADGLEEWISAAGLSEVSPAMFFESGQNAD